LKEKETRTHHSWAPNQLNLRNSLKQTNMTNQEQKSCTQKKTDNEQSNHGNTQSIIDLDEDSDEANSKIHPPKAKKKNHVCPDSGFFLANPFTQIMQQFVNNSFFRFNVSS
jgi:hypothetical protein